MRSCAVLALLALSLTTASATSAQDARIDRLDVIESGFYTAKKTGEHPAAGAPLGYSKEVVNVEFLKQLPAAVAVGSAFGVRLKVYGAPSDWTEHLRLVWLIPEPGIHNPNNGKIFHRSESDLVVRVGETTIAGYSFDAPWEVVKGTWTLQLWQGNRMLLEKSFVIE